MATSPSDQMRPRARRALRKIHPATAIAVHTTANIQRVTPPPTAATTSQTAARNDHVHTITALYTLSASRWSSARSTIRPSSHRPGYLRGGNRTLSDGGQP